jgi:hypothetical protein
MFRFLSFSGYSDAYDFPDLCRQVILTIWLPHSFYPTIFLMVLTCGNLQFCSICITLHRFDPHSHSLSLSLSLLFYMLISVNCSDVLLPVIICSSKVSSWHCGVFLVNFVNESCPNFANVVIPVIFLDWIGYVTSEQ